MIVSWVLSETAHCYKMNEAGSSLTFKSKLKMKLTWTIVIQIIFYPNKNVIS